MSRTLSGLFLVISEKSGKAQKKTKKKKGQVQIGKPPPFEHPPPVYRPLILHENIAKKFARKFVVKFAEDFW